MDLYFFDQDMIQMTENVIVESILRVNLHYQNFGTHFLGLLAKIQETSACGCSRVSRTSAAHTKDLKASADISLQLI